MPASALVRASTEALGDSKFSVAFARGGFVETNCVDIRDAQTNPNPEMSDVTPRTAGTCRKYVITVTPTTADKSVVRIESHTMYLDNDVTKKRWNDEVEQANWDLFFKNVRNDL